MLPILLPDEAVKPEIINGHQYCHQYTTPKVKGKKPVHSPLVHPPDESVDLVFPVTSVTSLHEVGGLLVHAATGRGQLEGPQEVVGDLEVLAYGVDLVDQVLNTDDAIVPCKSEEAQLKTSVSPPSDCHNPHY